MKNNVTRREFVRDTAAVTAGMATGLGGTRAVRAGNLGNADTLQILNYNEQMEYRRCGKTGLMISAVGLGGHWKRIDKEIPGLFTGKGRLVEEFEKNRHDVVTRCIDRGINYLDACTGEEVMVYSKALKGRRDKMYFGYSWHPKEINSRGWRSAVALKRSFDQGLKAAGLDYVDVWRITMHEYSARHTDREIEVMIRTLDWAKKTGRARFTGVASHDQAHLKKMIQTYPEQVEVVLTPYTSNTKMEKDGFGLYAAIAKHDVGWFGFKPFASNGLFQGDGSPGNLHEEEDSKTARLAIRAVLTNPAITASIPGLLTIEQVDNVAIAVLQRRELDVREQSHLKRAGARAWANLPDHYQWLKDWEYI